MTRWLRNTRVGLRLGAAFGIMAVLLVAVAGAGLWGSQMQQRATRDLVSNQAATQGVIEAKFLAADFKRAQNSYALDIALDVPNATVDTVGERHLFLVTLTTFAHAVAAVRGEHLTVIQAGVVASVDSGFTQFVAGDDQAIALYRQATPAAFQRATTLIVGRESALYEAMATAINSLIGPLGSQQASLAAASSDAARRSRTLLPLASGAALILACALAVLITRSLVRPLRAAQQVLENVAAGDLRPRLSSTSTDEVGQMGLALNQTLDRMSETVDGIALGSATLSASSEELSAVSQEMSATAEQTATQAATVSAAAEQVSQNLQIVVSSTGELSNSISEIARSTSDAALVATQGVAVAETTGDLVGRLGVSSAEIGDVIRVITSIAEQTNLLALNATIEAARAGEAGKGFAVVATEVKDLARKTARSSDEVGRTIETIQSDTAEAVRAISQITSIIHQISEIQAAIAASVEEQAATTRQIGHSVSDAALGSSEIARNVVGVAEAAHGTTIGAAETHRAAEELASLAGDLLGLVSHFRLVEASPRTASTRTASTRTP